MSTDRTEKGTFAKGNTASAGKRPPPPSAIGFTRMERRRRAYLARGLEENHYGTRRMCVQRAEECVIAERFLSAASGLVGEELIRQWSAIRSAQGIRADVERAALGPRPGSALTRVLGDEDDDDVEERRVRSSLRRTRTSADKSRASVPFRDRSRDGDGDEDEDATPGGIRDLVGDEPETEGQR